MKKELLLFVILSFLLSLTIFGSAQANEKKSKTITISKEHRDVSGDRNKDIILLTGRKMKGGQFQNLQIKINASNHKHYKIKLGNGYKPNVQLLDLNHDGIKDVFSSIQINDHGADSRQNVYTLKNEKLTNLRIPSPLVLDSRFLNGYKAKVKIKKNGNTYLFNLKDRKRYYERLGIFYKGKLNEPTELMVNSYSRLKPVFLKGEKIGLKGSQKITGASELDTIGYVESSWYYDQSHWKLVDVVVLKRVNS